MNKPKLRFKEFSDEWASYKVEELISSGFIAKPMDGNHGELHPKSEDYVQDGIPFVMANDIRDGDIDLNHCHQISRKQADSLQKGFSIVDDVLLTHKGTVGETAIVKNITTDYIMLTPQVTYYRVTNKNKLNHIFLRKYFQSQIFQRKLAILSSGGTRAYIGITEQRKLLVNLPSLAEQEKISSFLSELDQKIFLLNKKYELLLTYKKGLMQKLCNKEIRFKDDEGREYPNWEQKTLGDIGTFQTSSIDKLTKENESKIFLVNYMNVYRHENINNQSIKTYPIVSAKDSQIQSCNLKKGDILFTPSSETPDDIGHSVVISEDLVGAVYSYHLMRFRPKIKIGISYSHYFCNTQDVLSQLTKLATGATRFTISVKSFSSIKVSLPCLEEQEKIASLLISIDNKIAHARKQLELNKMYRQGLLQQMFV